MLTISSKRIKGSGKGTEIGFPTVNFILDELPSGLEIGLYAIINQLGQKGLSLISKYKSQYRIETHIIKKNINVNVGTMYSLIFLDKLRDPIRTRDVKSMIENDIRLATDYFSNFKTCLSCELCYIQDHGYSNYTVEGSNIGCYAGVFEEGDYSNRDTIDIYNSAGCKHMTVGSHWKLDVDGESERPSDDWIKMILRDRKIKDIIE